MPDILDTNAKALRINLDPAPYGTFAEIGGGQEISRWFFRVGGAAGTVAKTISAYDMTVSDAIYGGGERYVSRERLRSMLDHEYALLRERLGPLRGEKTTFFVLADTVATRNFKGTNESHGWIGLRVQDRPGVQPSDVLVHVSLRDPTALLQQQTLGVFGVNLLYAAVYLRENRAAMLKSLLDGLTAENLEIDVVECSGPGLAGFEDEKSVAIDMLAEGLTRAVVFDEQGKMEQPSSVFRKRGLVVHRCSLTRENPEMERMLASASKMLKHEAPQLERGPLPILEMSVAGVLNERDKGREGARSRMDWLVRPRHAALVTSYAETFHISGYLRRYTPDPVRFVTGLDGVVTMVREQFYTGVTGGVLEGLGRLYAPDVKVCVFSMPAGVFWERLARYGVERSFVSAPSKDVLSIADVRIAPPIGHLVDFLREAGWVVGVGED
jgi:hypothetical protein